jgi:hypothetical protein
MMFFANLVARTKTITFGTAVVNVPNHHPAMSPPRPPSSTTRQGPLHAGRRPGGLISDFELFKCPTYACNRMVVEAVDDPAHLDAGPAYTLAGEFWNAETGEPSCRRWRRLHAEAVSARRPADLGLARKPELLAAP